MKLIATKAMRYAGRSLIVGDEFEASEKDARILKAIRKAADAPVEEAALPKSKYKTRHLTAEE